MITFTTRFSEPLIRPLDELAAAHGMSRNAYLEHLARQAVRRGFVPIQRGEGLRASSPSGAQITFVLDAPLLITGQQSLAKSEQFAFVRARKLAEQGDWHGVKDLLVQAGFIVAPISAEPSSS